MALHPAELTSETYVSQEGDLYICGVACVFIARSVFNQLGPSAGSQIALQLRSAYKEEVFLGYVTYTYT